MATTIATPNTTGGKASPAKKAVPVAAVTTVVVDAAPAAATEVVAVVEADLASRFESVTKVLAAVMAQVRDLQSTIKTLQKDTTKAIKVASTKKGRRAPAGDKKPRAPSGFAKPTPLSDELCAFLGVPAGTELARTEVTRRINEYIKTKALQAVEDKRTIKPDAALQKLMNVPVDAKLTYFNLQSHMKHHFLKATV